MIITQDSPAARLEQALRAAGLDRAELARSVGVRLAEVGRWLEDFHPYSLVELDYGGLVHLVSDDALRGDQSVAEIRAGLDGAARGEARTRRGHVHARPSPVACIRRIRAGELITRGVRGRHLPRSWHSTGGAGRVVPRGASRALGGLRPIPAGQLFPNLT